MLRYAGYALLVVLVLGLGITAGGVFVLYKFGRGLPDYHQLANYEPPVATRVHAGDGRLIAEFARQQRLFVPISQIPKKLDDAFISAEDKNFYSHIGIDPMGILRSALINASNMFTDRRPVGASTITQQVAQNFFLSKDVSYVRKIKEAILSFRIEQAFTKDQILELYLNEIYLGFGSYGVAAAALNYFNKSLDELTLPEMAYLAALPKGPGNYNPVRHYDRAIERRNWVLERMYDDGYITKPQMESAQATPLTVVGRGGTDLVKAEYFTEEVRRWLYDRYGETRLYDGGLSVRTTLNTELQSLGEHVLRNGLIAYDRRHGWRGPISKISTEDDWAKALESMDVPLGMATWQLAVVLGVDDQSVRIGLAGGDQGVIPMSGLSWARPRLEGQRVGAPPKTAHDVLSVGDVIAVKQMKGDAGSDDQTQVQNASLKVGDEVRYELEQIPEIEGALIAMDPHTGRVLALVGGYDYDQSQFDRAIQAQRQPGSAFKPFVYAAALDHGFTPSSLILDAPIVVDQGYGLGKWKPENYEREFYGPSTLRLGIEKSRNVMTVRLAENIGMPTIIDYAKRFDIVDNMPPLLSMALGAGETTVLRLTTAYAMLDNGGLRITPTLIDRVQDRRGKTIFRHDTRECPHCQVDQWVDGMMPPELPDTRERVVDARTAYQVVSLLEGVIQRGTGVIIKSVGKPLAGKTGTTSDAQDAWFVGFSPDLVVGVYTGFDKPHTLGPGEQGASVAAPIFRDFMAGALKNEPAIPFRIPEGIKLVRVDAKTGLPAEPGDTNVIMEAFKQGTEPHGQQPVLDGVGTVMQTGTDVPVGTGGLY
jgi:penicillin-binding protein 1A